MRVGICTLNNRVYIQEQYERFYKVDRKYLFNAAKISDPVKTFPENNSLPVHPNEMKLIFMEISFDPISRIKRGMFYKIESENPKKYKTEDNSLEIIERRKDPYLPEVELIVFESYYPVRENFQIVNSKVFMGNDYFQTRWKIISIESTTTNEEVYVLQESLSLGVIPNIDYSKIPDNFHNEVRTQYESLLSELNSYPDTVIEHCTSFVVSILASYLNDNSDLELERLINKIDKKYQVKNYSEVIRIFHSRCKPNKNRIGWRANDRFDADMAVNSAFQIIRELGWEIRS